MMTDLPEIKIVKHVRAKRLRLRVEPDAVRLTVPVFCTQKQIQAFLAQSQTWLEKTWQQQMQQRNAAISSSSEALTFFNDSTYRIVEHEAIKLYRFDHGNQQLLINAAHRAYALKEATFNYAKQVLPDYLMQISRETTLSFNGCTIRRPKTRWGSCTAQKDIMLHAGLVLMDIAVVRYVCIHELAHTRHFNHGPEFWTEVQRHDQAFQKHQQRLNQMQLPHWWYSA